MRPSDTDERGRRAPRAAAVEDPNLALLNRALGSEIRRYLRHKRRFYAATDRGAGSAAQVSLEHAHWQLDRAQRLAARIVTLGGAPDFTPEELADADRIAMRLTAS